MQSSLLCLLVVFFVVRLHSLHGYHVDISNRLRTCYISTRIQAINNPDTGKLVTTLSMPQSVKKSILETFAAASKVLAVTTISYSMATAPTRAAGTENRPEITNKCYIDIKIANYTEESVGRNRAAAGSGRITVALYGKAAPESVKLFLDTIKSSGLEEEEGPSFVNALFSRVNPDENVLEIEKLRGLEPVLIAGKEEFEYRGKIMPYKPILENSNIKHDKRGLLTRKQLTSTPEFGITMNANSELDAFHVVFGEVIDGFEVLDAIGKFLQSHAAFLETCFCK